MTDRVPGRDEPVATMAGDLLPLPGPVAAIPAVLVAISIEATSSLVAGGGILLGWAFATALRRQDHRTFVLARAPHLPIRALAAHDDAWLRGVVVAAQPLQCPWFDTPCVAYAYTVEKQVTKTSKKADGKTVTETSWETETSESQAIDFDLDDGDRVRVLLPMAKNEAMQTTGHDYETSRRRHSASILPVGAVVSVLGVLRDDRAFGPMAEVPLLVTAVEPAQRVRGSARSEAWLFGTALLFPFAGVGVATGLWTGAGDVLAWCLAMLAGLLVWVPQWWLLTHNRLLRLRQQVRASQKQIGVDLAVRSDLMPKLVEVVRAAAAHEHDLLQRLAAVRGQGSLEDKVRAERDTVATARAVLMLHERHPTLRSDALYRDLHERLWAIEEKIAHARGFYNGIVTEWNNRLAAFPSLLVARAAGHHEAPLFVVADDEPLPPRLGPTP